VPFDVVPQERLAEMDSNGSLARYSVLALPDLGELTDDAARTLDEFDAAEAATFGPTLQRFAHLLREVTGALRIYTGSLNEGSPHFHCHLLPRLPVMPNNAIGWNAFRLSELARRGEVRANPREVERVLEAVRERASLSL